MTVSVKEQWYAGVHSRNASRRLAYRRLFHLPAGGGKRLGEFGTLRNGLAVIGGRLVRLGRTFLVPEDLRPFWPAGCRRSIETGAFHAMERDEKHNAGRKQKANRERVRHRNRLKQARRLDSVRRPA
jgi:hypothetical protein